MKIRYRWILGILLLLGVTVTGFVFLRSEEVVPEYVFSYAENQDAEYPTTLGGQYFAKLVEERTGGRIKILVQHSGERGSESEVIQQLQYGGIDFARLSLTEFTDELRELKILQMPYLYEDSEHMWRVLDGEIGDYFLEILGQSEVVGLSWYDAGARNFYTINQPIRKMKDIQGMKIRVQDSYLMADMVKCLGGEPVKQAYSEVYALLERKEVQGAENNWPSYETMQHYEVAEYYTVDEHTRIPEIQVCAKHTWEKLSEEDQKIILECAKESSLYQREVWEQREETSKKLVLEKGTEVITLSEAEKEKFRQAVEPLYEKYCKDFMDVIERIRSLKNN